MNRIIIILFFIFCHLEVFSQSPVENHGKYWYYRYRLNNNFVKIGDCDGCSLPAESRRLDGTLNWGDGQDWGWYIGIL